MIHIPSSEIKQPEVHADTLGFTFIWNGHFLRGIFPESVDLAKSYFGSGFLDEIVSKGLFPKTWISDFENEQFGMIIEHEMISPVLFASEWNSAMLKDAALMVLDIAEVGFRYGYNMVDCHKKNVLFRNNKPIYVDLGSFVYNVKGCTGWKPYKSFLGSYYYILDVWTDGCSQIAKCLMAPCVMMSAIDYYLYKKPVWRFAKKLLSSKLKIAILINSFAIMGVDNPRCKSRIIGIAKFFINGMLLGDSQRLASLRKRVEKCKVVCPRISQSKVIELNLDIPQFESALIVNSRHPELTRAISNLPGVKQTISLIESDEGSSAEYSLLRGNCHNITDISYSFSVPLFVKGYFPDNRIKSDIVFVPGFTFDVTPLGIHNALERIKQYLHYSKLGKAVIIIQDKCMELINNLSINYQVKVLENQGFASEWGGICLIVNEKQQKLRDNE